MRAESIGPPQDVNRGTEPGRSRSARADLSQVPNPVEARDGLVGDGRLLAGEGSSGHQEGPDREQDQLRVDDRLPAVGEGSAPAPDDPVVPGLRPSGKGQLTEGDGPKVRTPVGQLAWSDLDHAVRSAQHWDHGPRTRDRAQPGRGPAGAGQVLLASDGPPVADAAGTVPAAAFLVEVRRRTLGWAERRSLGLISACGISVALAACAATWFSAGSRVDDLRAVVALTAGYLVLLAGRSLAGSRAAPITAGAGGATVGTDGTRWLAALGLCLSECAIYAGLAAGAPAEHWPGTWMLAIAVLGLVSVRDMMTACSNPTGFGDRSDTLLQRLARAVLTMPPGGRLLVVALTAPAWGARASLFALLNWAIISVGYGLAGRAVPALEKDPAELVRLRDDGAVARTLGMLVRGQLLPLPPAILGVAAVATLVILGLHGLPSILIAGPAIVMLLAAPGSSNRHSGRSDWLVPVLLLGAQILYLAGAGFATGVPGPVIFVLCSALLLRYADLAFPGRPVMLVAPRQPESEATESEATESGATERGTGLGWEGRLLFAGVAAALGIATYAYIALAAYLGGLIGAKAVASCLRPRADNGPALRGGPGTSRQASAASRRP